MSTCATILTESPVGVRLRRVVGLAEDNGLRRAAVARSFRCAREPHPAIGKRKTVSSLSDAEVIGRSLDEPEAFGLIYDRHAATVLRFLGRCACGSSGGRRAGLGA